MLNIRGIKCILLKGLLVVSLFLLTQCYKPDISQAVVKEPLPKIPVRFAIPPELEVQPEPPKKQLSDEEIIQRYWHWYNLLGIKLPSEEDKHQLKVAPIDYDVASGTFQHEVWDKPEEGKSANVSMIFDATTGTLYVIFNYAVWDELYKLPQGTQPAKPKEEMLEEASKYLKLIVGELANNFKISPPPYTEWVSRSGTGLKGYWEITWLRILNGYEFLGDATYMKIHEKYGLISFAFHMRSFPCSTEVKITEEEAKKIAWAGAQDTIARYPYHFPTNKIRRLVEYELCILNPNYVFSPGVDGSFYPYMDNRHTRLAYRTTFQLDCKSGAYKIVVDVDAITGEIIGGNYTKGKEEITQPQQQKEQEPLSTPK